MSNRREDLGRKFTFLETVRMLFRALKTFHEFMPGFMAIRVLTEILEAMRPLVALFMSARVINELSGARDVSRIILYVALTVGLVFLLSMAAALLRKRGNVGEEYQYAELELFYAKRYMQLDFTHIEDSRVTQMIADIRARANGNGLGFLRISWLFPMMARNAVTLAASLAMLAGVFVTSGSFEQNWLTSQAASLLLLLLVAAGLLSPLLAGRIRKAANDALLNTNHKNNTLFMFYMRYISGDKAAKDIRLYNQADTISEIMARRLGSKIWQWAFTRFALGNGVNGAVNALIGGAAYLFIGLRALFGMYAVGSVVQYVGAVTNFITSLSNFSDNIAFVIENMVYLHNVYEFLDLSAPPDGGHTPDCEDISIEFDKVSFKYPGSDTYVLRDISLHFLPGRRLAVVGMNGSGKTTMVKLLCHLYKPTEGTIRLNGIDIQEYSHAQYARLFSVVFQDFKLFSLPLGENVAVSGDYDREKVKNALVTAGFGERLGTLENGLDTMLGKDCDKNGVAISGGEGQKTAIARSIYRDSPFVIFDEPTAALDPISEYEVYTKLNEIVGGKTAVFISHRLSSCRFCDEVAVFHEGRIVQKGNHDALLNEPGGKYAELWNAQAQYYTEEAEKAAGA